MVCTVASVGDDQAQGDPEVTKDATQTDSDAADPALAKLDEPIMGSDATVWDKAAGTGAREAKQLPVPKAPSAAVWAKHRLSHLPFCAWCPICVACKRPNHHHRRYRHPERLIPFIVAD